MVELVDGARRAGPWSSWSTAHAELVTVVPAHAELVELVLVELVTVVPSLPGAARTGL